MQQYLICITILCAPDFFVKFILAFFVTLRYCIHHDSLCPGIWTLHSSGTCHGHRLPLGLESYHPHLAVLTCMDWCTSPGLEQVHPGDPPTRLLFGLGLERPQWYRLYPSLPPCLLLCSCGDHGILLWKHFVYSAHGNKKKNSSWIAPTPTALLSTEPLEGHEWFLILICILFTVSGVHWKLSHPSESTSCGTS